MSMMTLLLACIAPSSTDLPTPTSPTPTELPGETGDTGSTPAPTVSVGTPASPTLVAADATLVGSQPSAQLGARLFAGRFLGHETPSFFVQNNFSTVPGVDTTGPIDVVTGILRFSLEPVAPDEPERLVFTEGDDLTIRRWPFTTADGTLPIASFAPNTNGHAADARPWGVSNALTTHQHDRILLHRLGPDLQVTSTEELFVDPLGHSLAPRALSLDGDALAIRTGDPNGNPGSLVVDRTTRTVLTRWSRVVPEAVGAIDATPGLDLIVGSTDPGMWTLWVLPDVVGGSTPGNATTWVELPDRAGSPMLSSAVSIADFDGDGQADLAVGYPNAGDDGLPDFDTAGLVLVFRGPLPDGRLGPEDADLVFQVDAEVLGFGTTLLANDTDGDGRAELLVGAPRTGGAMGAAFRFDDVLRPWREANGRTR